MIFENLSSNEKINEWIAKSYAECKSAYPIPKKGKIAFDIGANVGGFCIHAHKKFDKIYAFEPLIENYQVARSVLENMNIKNVDLYNTAIYSESGKTLPIFGNNSGLISGDVTIVAEEEDPNYSNLNQTCETISLKDAMESLGVDFIDYLKLDCEGSEYEILENFQDYDKIKFICMEIHGVSSYNHQRKINLLKMLHENYHYVDLYDNARVYKSLSELINKSEKNDFMKYEKSSNLFLVNRNLNEMRFVYKK